jgi:hypothetical protein
MTSAEKPTLKPRADADSELILEAGVEGGALELFGTQTAHGWVFCRVVDETTMIDFLADEDRDGFGEPVQKSEWVDSWEGALALLDKYQWHQYHPVFVHPDFRQRVWSAVLSRFERGPSDDDSFQRHSIRRWLELCGRQQGSSPDLLVKSLGEHRGGTVMVKIGRYGPHIFHRVRDTIYRIPIPEDMSPESVTLGEAVALLGAGTEKGRMTAPNKGRS